jgi:hypothetical protein
MPLHPDPVFLKMFLGFCFAGAMFYAISRGASQPCRAREREHRERMRALELGRGPAGARARLTPESLGFLIAVAVPIGVFSLPALFFRDPQSYPEFWRAAGMVGVAAVVSGSLLAAHGFSRQYHDRQSPGEHDARKPMLEEDAFDVVSTRG